MDESLRYPIGRLARQPALDPARRSTAIAEIGRLPAALSNAVRGLTDIQLDTPYREGGWTVRQVVHHLADSHVNAYVRFKLALTEHRPTIKPYEEDRWAQLPDTSRTPVSTSLALLDALHERWVTLLGAMGPDDFERELVHPEAGAMRLYDMLALYAWHGRHHVAHVTRLRDRSGW